jgi:hypothetical protein
MAATMTQLMTQMQGEISTRISSQGGGIEQEMALVKQILDTLSKGGAN